MLAQQKREGLGSRHPAPADQVTQGKSSDPLETWFPHLNRGRVGLDHQQGPWSLMTKRLTVSPKSQAGNEFNLSHKPLRLDILQCFPPVRRRPWLVWLSGFSACLRTEGSWVPVQSGHMPGLRASSLWGVCQRQPHTDVSPSPSLPFPLFKNKFKKKNPFNCEKKDTGAGMQESSMASRNGVRQHCSPWEAGPRGHEHVGERPACSASTVLRRLEEKAAQPISQRRSKAEIFTPCSAPCAARTFKTCRPDYLVRGTELFSLRLPPKVMATANTTRAIQCE